MRLAERQGLLTGKHLSSVQSLALEMLMLLDQRATGEQFVTDLKSRIVAANPSEFPVMFPEWASSKAAQDGAQEALRPDGSYDIDKIDDSQVEWSIPTTEAENEEHERWVSARTAISGGTISAAELENGGWM